MLTIFMRALILYLVVVIFMRMMGKRQIGQMQPYEIVITLLVADVVAAPMQDPAISLVEGIIPMIALFICHNFISFLCIKSRKLRKVFCGKTSTLIRNGVINEKELKKLSLSVEELMEALRAKDAFSLDDVYCATMETNGQLSVMFQNKTQPPTMEDLGMVAKENDMPLGIHIEGEWQQENLKTLGLTSQGVEKTLKIYKVDRRNVFFAMGNRKGELTVQIKGGNLVRYKVGAVKS